MPIIFQFQWLFRATLQVSDLKLTMADLQRSVSEMKIQALTETYRNHQAEFGSAEFLWIPVSTDLVLAIGNGEIPIVQELNEWMNSHWVVRGASHLAECQVVWCGKSRKVNHIQFEHHLTKTSYYTPYSAIPKIWGPSPNWMMAWNTSYSFIYLSNWEWKPMLFKLSNLPWNILYYPQVLVVRHILMIHNINTLLNSRGSTGVPGPCWPVGWCL